MLDRQSQRITAQKRRHTRRRRFLATARAAGLLVCGLAAMVPSSASAANVFAPPAGAADVAGTVDLIGATGTAVRSFDTAYDPEGDAIAMGDMTNDPYEDRHRERRGIQRGGRIDVLDLFGDPISSFDSAYDDDGDALAVGDITNDGAAEAVIANAGGSSEGGRIDVLNLFGHTISSFDTAYDDAGDRLAVGDVTGDGAEEVVIANAGGPSENGRIDVLNLYGHVIASFGNTGYDGGDTIAVGNVTGDARAEIAVSSNATFGLGRPG